MNWKLKEYLESYKLKPIDLVRETELSTNTIYPMTRNEAKRIDRETLETVLVALRRMTGQDTQLADILVSE